MEDHDAPEMDEAAGRDTPINIGTRSGASIDIAASIEPGSLLRAMREELGYGQRELARAAGCSQPQICVAERGGDLRLSTLRRLIAAMGGKVVFGVRLKAAPDRLLAERHQALEDAEQRRYERRYARNIARRLRRLELGAESARYSDER